MFTLIAALVLAAWVFRALFHVDIMNKHQVDLGKILDVYVSWLHIDFLIAYFVAIDISTLGVNLNFSACAHCADEQKREFAVARQGLVISLLFGVLFLAFQVASTQMHPARQNSFRCPTTGCRDGTCDRHQSWRWPQRLGGCAAGPRIGERPASAVR